MSMPQSKIVTRPNGVREWLVSGKHHREDGPAVVYPDGPIFWYLNGEFIISERFTQSSNHFQQCEDFKLFAIIYLTHNS